MYMTVMVLFAVTTLIGVITHYRITTTQNPSTDTYAIRFFTITFGTIGIIGLPTIETLQQLNPYFTTPQGISAIYLTGTVMALTYMWIAMNVLLPTNNVERDSNSQPKTLN